MDGQKLQKIILKIFADFFQNFLKTEIFKIWALCSEIACSAYQTKEVTLSIHINSVNPISKILENTELSAEVSITNIDWMEKVLVDLDAEDFMIKIINLENTMVVTPDKALLRLDKSPFCWAIVTYNGLNSKHEGLFN